MFISLFYKKRKKKKKSREGKRESGLDRLTEGPNNHVQKPGLREAISAGMMGGREGMKERKTCFKGPFEPSSGEK